jgi:hypothetical protein
MRTALVLDVGDTLLRDGTTWVVAGVAESVDRGGAEKLGLSRADTAAVDRQQS